MDDAFFCAHWDGNHIWIQWASDAQFVRWRVRTPETSAWGEWTIIPIQPTDARWIVISTWKEDFEVQAGICVAGEWIAAVPVDFLQNTALFSLLNKSTSERLIESGSLFHAVVDGASCCYVLESDISIPPGKSVSVRLSSLHLTGYAQLDHAGHFQCDSPDLHVENLDPSSNDLKILPADRAVISARTQTAVTLSFVP